MSSTTATTAEVHHTAPRRAIAGAVVGHLIEWYEYGVYGFLAAYIGQAFFAAEDEMVQLLASFATFALSFFVRPLGGIVFGPLSDRIGRRATLAIVLVMMSGSTFCIGLLPTAASIGVLAPVLLIVLRLVQGFSAGGEGGSVTAFLAEYAAPGRRGLSLSYLMITGIGGMLLGSLTANGIAAVLDADAMAAWGWRAPFLLAGPLGVIGIYIRVKLEDTPAFRALQANGEVSKRPLREMLRYRRGVLLAFFTTALHGSAFYLTLVYANTYFSVHLEMSAPNVLIYVTGAGAVAMIVTPIFASLSDRIGRKKVLLIGAGGLLVATVPFFLAGTTGNLPIMTCAYAAIAVFFAIYVSATLALHADLFPAKVRASGTAVPYSLAQAVFGGSAPLIATYLVDATSNVAAPAYFFVLTAVASLIAVLAIRPTDLAGRER